MKVKINSAEKMQELGQRLAHVLPTSSVVELIGDVGAGKTTLVKGIGKGLDITQTIQSPSYTIFCRYEGQQKSLHHYDFYRLLDPGLASFDLEESLSDEKAVTVVEWADSVKGVLPPEHVIIHIVAINENEREVMLQGVSL